MEEEKSCPFSLIERGNSLESGSDPWGALEAFSSASAVLRSLSLSQCDPRIAELYREQRLEYLRKSRDLFLRTLEEETRSDDATPRYESLSREERERRMEVFRRIFVDIGSGAEDEERRALSLEERLAALNHSLPDPETRRTQRLQDLGVYIPPSIQDTPPILPPEPSSHQQVQSILSLAKDEVALSHEPQSPSTQHHKESLLSLIKEDSVMQLHQSTNPNNLSQHQQIQLILQNAKHTHNLHPHHDCSSHSSSHQDTSTSTSHHSTSSDDESSISVLSL